MPDGIKSTISLLADYIIAYLTISNDIDLNDLQKDLDKLATWGTKWKMVFHPDKCHVLLIPSAGKTIPLQHPISYMVPCFKT